jgi:hypothetical protein
MVLFMFSGVSTTPLLMNQLAEEHRWLVWNGTFDEVLPYLREAFNQILELFGSPISSAASWRVGFYRA